MTKRKFIAEEDASDRYADADCPECGATINTRFQPGRNWRRLQCPVCQTHVTVSIQAEEKPLIQLQRADPE